MAFNETIHNYYERLVGERIEQASRHLDRDENFWADVSCVALNRLPPRYIRHDVDMIFYCPPEELEEMYDNVFKSVDEAIRFVDMHVVAKQGVPQEGSRPPAG